VLPGHEVFVLPVREHRFVLVVRGPSLGGALTETDPLSVGLEPLPVRDESGTEVGSATAEHINRWVGSARQALGAEPRANSLNLRGLSMRPELPQYDDVFGLTAAAIAVYPMYRGAARTVGMSIVGFEGETPTDEIGALEREWERYDFFFVHIKKTDSYGEDGDFDAKVRVIEDVDGLVPRIVALDPDVVVVTGDHSTPAAMRSHSWHPVPTLLWGPRAIADKARSFGERECSLGGLGIFHATSLLPTALAHAGRLRRFGA
jgi:2,3-bisphosphoglycerate-independent phosphoglycerate mutase